MTVNRSGQPMVHLVDLRPLDQPKAVRWEPWMERRAQPLPGPTEIFAELIAAYNRGAPSAAAALYAATGRHEDVATGRPKVGPEAVARGMTGFLRSFPDARWTVQTVVGDDQRAAAAYEVTGTLQADLGPFAARGQALRIAGLLLIAVADGVITSSRDYWDSGTLARQLNAPAARATDHTGARR
jgi:steroid delta-isomerase-like uncharacterized protein